MVLFTLGMMHDLLCWYKSKMKPQTNIEATLGTLEREKMRNINNNNNRIQVDKEDFISTQIEVRLISTMLQDILESHQNAESTDNDDEICLQHLIETQTMPPLSRASSRNVSLRRQKPSEPQLTRTGSFPMISPRKSRQVSPVRVYGDDAGISSYSSYSNLTNQPRKPTSRTKSWKIPRTRDKPSTQIRRYQTFYKIPNSMSAEIPHHTQTRKTRAVDNNNNNGSNNNSRIQRHKTFASRPPSAKRNKVQVRRGQSFPARYHQALTQLNQNSFSNGTAPRTFNGGETKKRPPLYDLSFVSRHVDHNGQIGNISLDYGDVMTPFDDENPTVVITEC